MLQSLTLQDEYVDNQWALMVTKNIHVLTEKNKQSAQHFFSRITYSKIKGFDNLFCTDGYSMECITEITNNLIQSSAEREIYYPYVKANGTTIFCSYGEGWSKDEFFETLHNLIDFLKLTGSVTYTTGVINIEECYDKFCKKYNKTPRLICRYNGNPTFFDIASPHYALPNVSSIDELPIEDKKLFCSFNWNAWNHRLALIALFNHYNLIDDGYITSPGVSKYNYDKNDFNLLKRGCAEYINQLPESQKILENLENLKSRYPLKIDDRSKYKNTDDPLTIPNLKIPLLTARINSIIEVVSETRWFGGHFLSEKFYNPVLLGKPFLILAAVGSLKSIRSLGFKTFDNYIDESYDEIENDAERTLAIVKELDRLKSMRINNPKDFYSLLENCKVIAQYNLEFFVNNAHYPTNLYFKVDNYLRFMKLC